MMPSDLLQNPRTYGSLTPDDAWARWASTFGAAAVAPGEDWELALASAPTGQGTNLWHHAMAVEWLLRSWVKGGHLSCPKFIVPTPFPFGTIGCGKMKPSDLTNHQGAATVFLLDVGPFSKPAIALLLAWRDVSKTPLPLECLPPLPGMADIHFIVIPSRPDITTIAGESWHLAAHLLAHYLQPGFEEEKKRLLCDWASSGRLVGCTLERIELPARKLQHPSLAGRTVLLPLANQADASALAPKLKLRPRIEYAADTATAIAKIGNRRPKRLATDLPFPLDEVPVMHVLVGGSPGAVLAPVALRRPKRLVLWHSREPKWKALAEAMGDALKAELAHDLQTDPNPQILELPSNDLAAAWDALQPILSADLKKEPFVVFNITSGNRIMGLATLPLAQFEPTLVLVYRDIDAEPFTLTSLHFHGVRPDHATFRPTWANEPNPRVEWDNFFFKPNKRSTSSKDIIKLLKKCPEIPPHSRLEDETPPA